MELVNVISGCMLGTYNASNSHTTHSPCVPRNNMYMDTGQSNMYMDTGHHCSAPVTSKCKMHTNNNKECFIGDIIKRWPPWGRYTQINIYDLWGDFSLRSGETSPSTWTELSKGRVLHGASPPKVSSPWSEFSFVHISESSNHGR